MEGFRLSDYPRENYESLPGQMTLFEQPDSSVVEESARNYHESKVAQAKVLSDLRSGRELFRYEWERDNPGGRLAPAVEQLRNAHGLTIDGKGTQKRPYKMPDNEQLPTLVAATDSLKSAYYASLHWQGVRQRRWVRDSYTCVLCGQEPDEGELRCHHIYYALFREHLSHLLTACAACHETLHAQSKLKFPSGMLFEHAQLLDPTIEFESWLLPGAVV